jgi:hypothetical protein
MFIYKYIMIHKVLKSGFCVADIYRFVILLFFFLDFFRKTYCGQSGSRGHISKSRSHLLGIAGGIQFVTRVKPLNKKDP